MCQHVYKQNIPNSQNNLFFFHSSTKPHFQMLEKSVVIFWTVTQCPRTRLLTVKGEHLILANDTSANQHLGEAHMVLPSAWLQAAKRKSRNLI